MRIPTIYLETTIFNFSFVDDAPQHKADTLKLFAEIKAGKFRPFTSEYVTRELETTTDSRREDMLRLVQGCGVEVLPISIEGMTPEERRAYYREGTRAAFARLGITPKYASPNHDNA